MITIHDAFCKNFNNNGFGILKHCKTAEVTESLNGELSLKITYPVGGYLYDALIEGNILVSEIGYGNRQAFRIQTVTKHLKEINVYATHIFYDLKDNLLLDTYPQNLSGDQAIKHILSHTQFVHEFLGTSDINDTNTARLVRKNVVEALIGDEDNSFINRWGGEILRDNYTITMLQQRGIESGMKIMYAKNLTGVEFKIDRTTIATRIIPKGFDALLLPEIYVDSNNIELYPHPIIKVIEYSNVKLKESEEDTDGYENPEEAYDALRKYAQEEFKNEIDLPTITTTVDFIELGTTEEYKQYKNLEKLNIGDYVSLYIPHLNINVSQRVYKTTYDVLRMRYTKFEMGYEKTNFVLQTIHTNNTLSQVTTTVELVQKTSSDMITEQLIAALSGFVYKTTDALYIMDTNALGTANKLWRWNKLGLAYSNRGVGGPYTIAMNQDGEINGDFIKYGKINTDLLEGKINTELLDGKINTSILEGKIKTEMLEGKIKTSWLDGTIDTTLLEGKINTESLEGKISTSMLDGDIYIDELTIQEYINKKIEEKIKEYEENQTNKESNTEEGEG